MHMYTHTRTHTHTHTRTHTHTHTHTHAHTITHYHSVTCDHPSTPLLRKPVVMVTGSEIPKLTEGQSITYTCPPEFILTGPRASVCIGNRELEPDPGQVDCIGDCEDIDTIHTYMHFN